jgi:hypothetical protein
MALINDPNITRQIRDLAGTGTLDTTQIVNLLNSVLPAGQQVSDGFGVTTGVYKRFGEFDKVNAKIEVVTTGLWSGDSGSLNLIYSSSTQTAQTSGQYYYNVYDKNPQTDSSAEIQFAVAYGHVNGSGSITLANDDNSLLASKATYAQYRSMLLDPTDTKFSFANSAGVSIDSNDVYIINLSRSRYREKMDAGNWSLSLSGSNGMFTFIDNSGKKFSDENGLSGRVFKVVSGSLNLGTENEATVKTTTDVTSGEGFGLFYPDRGIIVLNPKALGNTVGNIYDNNWNLVGNLSGSLDTATEQYNHKRLYHAIRTGGKVSAGFAGQYGFEARRTENVSTQHFFVRATNREFNYSNNPTYVNADGTFVETTFKTDPYTYITTVGLLSDANEVLAIAKTSQPIAKSFDKEVLIKVKLSF